MPVMKKRRRLSVTGVLIEPGKDDIFLDEEGLFVASYKGERIGRFGDEVHAKKMWRRWAASYESGVTSPASSFTAVPRVNEASGMTKQKVNF
jgi:hypothetical protein